MVRKVGLSRISLEYCYEVVTKDKWTLGSHSRLATESRNLQNVRLEVGNRGAQTLPRVWHETGDGRAQTSQEVGPEAGDGGAQTP